MIPVAWIGVAVRSREPKTHYRYRCTLRHAGTRSQRGVARPVLRAGRDHETPNAVSGVESGSDSWEYGRPWRESVLGPVRLLFSCFGKLEGKFVESRSDAITVEISARADVLKRSLVLTVLDRCSTRVPFTTLLGNPAAVSQDSDRRSR